MSRVFITGSSDGLGLMAGRCLPPTGIRSSCTPATRSGRTTPGGAAAKRPACWSATCPTGRDAAGRRAGQRGRPVRRGHPQRRRRLPRAAAGADRGGLAHLLAINVLAPYFSRPSCERPAGCLPELGHAPRRRTRPRDPTGRERRWNGSQAYADSKLFDALLAFAVARRWPDVPSQRGRARLGADPDGRPQRPGRPRAGPVTQAWLAVSDDPAAPERRLLLPPATAGHPTRRR